MEKKPIDRSKKSNKRCINCAHYKDRVFPPATRTADRDYMLGKCPTADNKPVNYWNCCKHFQWDPNKLYTEPLEP